MLVYATDNNLEKHATNEKDRTKIQGVPVPSPSKIQIYKHVKPDGKKLIQPVNRYEIKQHLIVMHQVPVQAVDMTFTIVELGTYEVKYNNGKTVKVEVLPETRW